MTGGYVVADQNDPHSEDNRHGWVMVPGKNRFFDSSLGKLNEPLRVSTNMIFPMLTS